MTLSVSENAVYVIASDVKRYPINDVSVSQIDIRMSTATPHIETSMSVNTLRSSLFPLKQAVACIPLPGDGEPSTRSHTSVSPSLP